MRTCPILDFVFPDDQWGRIKESYKRDLDLVRKLRDLLNIREPVILTLIGTLRTVPKNLEKSGRVRNRRTNRDHPNYSLCEIVQTSEKTPRNLRRLDIAQTLAKDLQLTLVWKTYEKWCNNCSARLYGFRRIYYTNKWEPGRHQPTDYEIIGNKMNESSMILFTNPSARAGYDTRSIFKRSLTGLNSEFSFS